MDLIRQLEFFDPTKITEEIHVIGVGAIGSHIVEMLTRMGVEDINIYDFDTVDAHNIPNQLYAATDIGLLKTEALTGHCCSINPDINIRVHNKGYQPGTRLSGYVFLCVDSIDLRRAIATEHQFNPMIKAMFDFRMGLKDAQHYAADWHDDKSKETFLANMAFTDEEAKAAMPVSACGTALSVLPTIRAITAYGIANWLNFVKTQKLKKVILADAFAFTNMVF